MVWIERRRRACKGLFPSTDSLQGPCQSSLPPSIDFLANSQLAWLFSRHRTFPIETRWSIHSWIHSLRRVNPHRWSGSLLSTLGNVSKMKVAYRSTHCNIFLNQPCFVWCRWIVTTRERTTTDMSELSQTDRSSRLVGHSKSVQSKYDYIKIKIWLGADKVHYYILSRYILSRTLTCAKIPQDSVRTMYNIWKETRTCLWNME